jgi:hypothetical protein
MLIEEIGYKLPELQKSSKQVASLQGLLALLMVIGSAFPGERHTTLRFT